MAKDELAELYDREFLIEGSTENKLQAKTNMKVGGKNIEGDLEGAEKARTCPKGTGPEAVKELKKVQEAPKELSSIKKSVKENKDMGKSFQELFDEVMIEADLEDIPAGATDFPPAEDETAGTEIGAEDDMEEVEALEGDKFSQLADLFSQAAELFRGMADEHGADDEASLDQEAMPPTPGTDETTGEVPPVPPVPPVGEAVSQPEPKPFAGNTKELQLPNRKLGGKGVKVVNKKASTTGSSKSHDGKLEQAPKGFAPGDKGMMRVSGSGPASSGKNASAFEQ